MERGSAMRWTAGSYPAAHVPILAGRRGKGVKCTSSRRVWQAVELDTGRTRRSKGWVLSSSKIHVRVRALPADRCQRTPSKRRPDYSIRNARGA